MGGNGSYSKEFSGVEEQNRTHFDTGFRINRHKVLVFQEKPDHDKIIMNSNSECPIYLFASADEETGKLTISCIGIYKKHLLTESIDIKFDSQGNALPFNETEDGSHSHRWSEVAPGKLGRKKHDNSNHLPIDTTYHSLIEKIVKFNKQNNIWKKND